VGHFPVRYTFAVRALQSAWLANFKTPLAWPAGRGPTGRRCVADGQSAATGLVQLPHCFDGWRSHGA
jgi:hypothetical protein